MHESLMRSFSRFMILAVCAMIVMLICCSFAAGQEPSIIFQRAVEFPSTDGQSSKYLLVQNRLDGDDAKKAIEQLPAGDWRPRPLPPNDGQTILPNGIDVPKLAGSQPQPVAAWPKFEVYMLVLTEKQLTPEQLHMIKWLFQDKTKVWDEFQRGEVRWHSPNDEREDKLAVVTDYRSSWTWWGFVLAAIPYVIGSVLTLAFLAIMWGLQGLVSLGFLSRSGVGEVTDQEPADRVVITGSPRDIVAGMNQYVMQERRLHTATAVMIGVVCFCAGLVVTWLMK